MSGRDWVLVDGVKYMRREDVIEECARVAEKDFLPNRDFLSRPEIAAAIRALKDKP